MLQRIALCLFAAALSTACSPVDCDYDLEGNPVNCRREPVTPGPALPESPQITLDVPSALGVGGATHVAVGGAITVHYTTTDVPSVATSVGAPFAIGSTTAAADGGHDLELVAAAAGSATLAIADPAAGSDVTATAALSAIPLTAIDYDLEDYTPQLGAHATAVLGRADVVVRLRGANDEALIDTSLSAPTAVSFPGLWDLFDVPAAGSGTTTLAITGSSFGRWALNIPFVDHLDAIDFTVTSSHAPDGYRIVCAYGLTNGAEVATSFALFAQNPSGSQDNGGDANCMIVDLGEDGYATVLARDPNGLTATIKVDTYSD